MPEHVSINQVLSRVDRVRQDAVDERTRAAWLLELEGKLFREVILRHECPGPLPVYPTRFPEDGDMPLLAGAPYDRLYDLYLMAQADFVNREWEDYNNTSAMFNDALWQFRRAWHREHRPLDPGEPL